MQLAAKGIAARVIDLYSVKPVDADAILLTAAAETKAVVTVEDHWAEGGIGETVAGVLAEAGCGDAAGPPRGHRQARQRPAAGICSPPPESTPRTSSPPSRRPSAAFPSIR